MAAAAQLVILLALGQFQAQIPGVTPDPSPVFEDSSKGARAFTLWAKEMLPVPKFNQPPLRVCVVGAVPFTPEKAPFLPKPLWESQPPLRALEPYTASFHYVESPSSAVAASGAAPAKAAAPKPRTMKEALAICAADAQTPQPVVPKPPPPKRLGATAPAASASATTTTKP